MRNCFGLSSLHWERPDCSMHAEYAECLVERFSQGRSCQRVYLWWVSEEAM